MKNIIINLYGAEMIKKLALLSTLLLSTNVMAEEYKTPSDMSEEAQTKMYDFTMSYNKCMMQSRLDASSGGQAVQKSANDILTKCETHLDQLKTHLINNDVFEPLAIGVTKKMRSRGARELMTKGMNQMAAQASAVANAEKMNDK
jgi:phage baseplate assembly protein gpV